MVVAALTCRVVDVPSTSVGVLFCLIVEMVSMGGGPHVVCEW